MEISYCFIQQKLLYYNITYTKPSKPSKTKKKPGSPDIAEVKEQVEDELRKEKEMLHYFISPVMILSPDRLSYSVQHIEILSRYKESRLKRRLSEKYEKTIDRQHKICLLV